jgi:hypothetical protein
MTEERVVTTTGIYYPSIYREIKKSNDPLQPVFESFTNSIESIRLLRNRESLQIKGNVTIGVYFEFNDILKSYSFDKLTIEDNGIGFDDENYGRLLRYKDDRKGINNKGTGRIQLVHYFKHVEFESIYSNDATYNLRHFRIDKELAEKDALAIELSPVAISNEKERKTKLTLSSFWDSKDKEFYDDLQLSELKSKLINKYILNFCAMKDSLPSISITFFQSGNQIGTEVIDVNDIPAVDKIDSVNIRYKKLSDDSKRLLQTENSGVFNLSTFRIPKGNLEHNSIKLTSKNEVLSDISIPINNLSPDDVFDGSRYLVLVASDYLTTKENDPRGTITLFTEDEYLEIHSSGLQSFLEKSEEIFIEDIESGVNESFSKLYPDLTERKQAKENNLQKLQEMFLLSSETLEDIQIKTTDTDVKILERTYANESKLVAKKDAEIKSQIDKLDELDPSKPEYQVALVRIATELNDKIPEQNRAALSRYVARRRLVLEMFDKILENKLRIQETTKQNIDEKLLHNMIFQQHSVDSTKSDLWLFNEEFVYFQGMSETNLIDMKINGKQLFKTEVTAEEERYLTSLGEDRMRKRPDILLFPTESKCIIIEFKNPKVNISNHLTQINKYASFLLNYSHEQFKFCQFYGYLIGEAIESKDVRFSDGNFIEASYFDFLFRPHSIIPGDDGRRDGSLYTEVIKYSTLLKRAKQRNKIFIDKLTPESPLHI